VGAVRVGVGLIVCAALVGSCVIGGVLVLFCLAFLSLSETDPERLFLSDFSFFSVKCLVSNVTDRIHILLIVDLLLSLSFFSEPEDISRFGLSFDFDEPLLLERRNKPVVGLIAAGALLWVLDVGAASSGFSMTIEGLSL